MTSSLSLPRLSWQVAAVCIGWYAVILAAQQLHPGASGHRLALVAHLAGLAVGFGSVLTLDLYGLAVLARRRTVAGLLRLSTALDPLVWTGFVVLAASGAFLRPDFRSAWTDLNLLAALVAALNGVYTRTLRVRVPVGARTLPRGLLRGGLAAGAVSQAAWWTSILIGTLTS